MGRSHVQSIVKDFVDSIINSDFKQNNMVCSVKHEEILYKEKQRNIYVGILYMYITLLLHYVTQKED
jgi:predicted nucleic acid-binding Zn ribbon protein